MVSAPEKLNTWDGSLQNGGDVQTMWNHTSVEQ